MLNILFTVLGVLMLAGVLVFIGWLMIRSLKRSEDPTWLIVRWILTGVVAGLLVLVLGKWGPSVGSAFVMPFACVFLGIILSLLWAPSLASLLARPIAGLFDGGQIPPDPEPLYSMAQAKRKQGRYQEALWDIQEQLNKFPNDFTGQMLVAAIQAENLHDLAAAAITVQRLTNQPELPSAQMADALTQLSEWHLKYAQDEDAARQALEEIVRRLPDSPGAHAANQRLAHLAGSRQMVMAAHDGPPVAMAHGDADMGLHLHTGSAAPTAPTEAPEQEARDVVKHLEQFPHDNEARERLALLYAHHYQRLDLAAGELEQLISQPGAPARRIAHWLNLLADLQLQMEQNEEAARQTLDRIIELFPDQAAAEMAAHRKDHLKLELKKSAAPHLMKLGVYEEYPGLKGKQPASAPPAPKRLKI